MHDRVPPEQHRQHIPNPPPDDDFEHDLHPKRNAGEDYGPGRLRPSISGRTLADEKDATQQLRGLSEAELKQVPVLAEGTRLEQGSTYIDLRDPDGREFTARGNMVTGPDNLYIPKSDVDYVLWNRLIGVTNPERLEKADDTKRRDRSPHRSGRKPHSSSQSSQEQARGAKSQPKRRHATDQGAPVDRIQQRLRHELSRSIAVAEQDGTMFLSGHVESEHARNQARQIAASLAPDRRIEDDLEVEHEVVEGAQDDTGLNADNLNTGGAADADQDMSLESSGIEDLDDVPLETDESDVSDESVYDDVPPVEPDPAYFAPTDPVVGSDQEGNLVVLGGWEPTSLSDEEVDRSAEDNRPGDEALADAIRRELREDAMTTDLQIEVQVEHGVARLRGPVPGLDEAEAAQDIASQVPGIRDVLDELDVAGM